MHMDFHTCLIISAGRIFTFLHPLSDRIFPPGMRGGTDRELYHCERRHRPRALLHLWEETQTDALLSLWKKAQTDAWQGWTALLFWADTTSRLPSLKSHIHTKQTVANVPSLHSRKTDSELISKKHQESQQPASSPKHTELLILTCTFKQWMHIHKSTFLITQKQRCALYCKYFGI